MRVDLHIHSALSACAENSLSPGRIVSRATAAGLEMIAVTDHNASANVGVAVSLGARAGIRVLPAMEISTREEVHILALFNEIEALLDLQQLIDKALPKQQNLPDFFGLQLVYDETDEIMDVDECLRAVGVNIGLDGVIGEIHARGGCAVPAHVERAKNSLTSQLGFIDPGAAFDAVELALKNWRRHQAEPGFKLAGFPALTGSDAHFLEDIGRHFFTVPGTAGTIQELLANLR